MLAGALCVAATAMTKGAIAAPADHDPALIEDWMNRWMDSVKALKGTLHVSRFVERVWFLTKPIEWYPNAGGPQYSPVSVPVGFVTDFASIPRIFWSLLPPDGSYTYAAILHDYLYWVQDRPRETADEILKIAMQDLKIDTATVFAIYQAVRLAGQSAWDENTQARIAGEKKVLKKFPDDDPTMTWREWKKREDVFR
jgi:hypothetical protein